MEYVKPSTRVSRMNIAASLLAGSSQVTDINDGNLHNLDGEGNIDNGQEGGGFMLARGRRMFSF